MSKPILVVEDNEDILLLMKLTLESEGYEINTAQNSKEAFSSLGKNQPLLVLMDIMMPGIDGLQVSRNIKNKRELQDVPVLLVSAIDRLKEEQLAASKADGILYKPFMLETLVSNVKELISN